MSLEIEASDRENAIFDNVELSAVQVGSEEITLANTGQHCPLKVRLVLRAKQKTVTFNFETSFAGANVEQVLKALNFLAAIAKGGLIRVWDQNTRLELLQSSMQPASFHAHDPRWLEITEDLVFIQRKAKVPIYIPDREITVEEIEAIRSLAERMRTGRAIFGFNSLTVTFTSMNKEYVQEILSDAEEGKPVHFRLDTEETHVLFGKEFKLGPAILHLEKVYIVPEGVHALKAAIESSRPDEAVKIRLLPAENCPAVAEYPMWISDTESEKTISE